MEGSRPTAEREQLARMEQSTVFKRRQGVSNELSAEMECLVGIWEYGMAEVVRQSDGLSMLTRMMPYS